MLSLSSIFITDAYAASSNASTQGGLSSMLPMLLFFAAIMYFMMIRPQQKRQKEHEKLLSNISKGDEVQTTSGIMGVIEAISTDTIVLQLSPGVSVMMQKSVVSQVLPKGSVDLKALKEKKA